MCGNLSLLYIFRVRKRSMVDDLNLTNPKVINLGNTELNNLWNQHPDNEVIIRSVVSICVCV